MKSYISENFKNHLIQLRRHFHMNPELSWKEVETAGFISKYLIEREFKVENNFVSTSVAGYKSYGEGPCVVLRADMDALPIQEKTGASYSSKNDNVMHACGHDGHMAMLLGVADILARKDLGLRGSVLLVFQPAEEGGAGGQKVVESGILEKYKAKEAYSIHLYSGVETGTLICPSGEFLASADEFEIIISGKGSHGAQPHLGDDPIVAASNIVLALQSVVSRNTDPLESSVVTVGQFKAGDAHNIIPELAVLSGTFRAFNESTRDMILKRVRELTENIGRAYRVKTLFKLFASYPPTVNHTENSEYFRNAALRTDGIKKVVSDKKLAVAEDFSFYLQKYPGAMSFLGSGNKDKAASHPHHSPYFDIDEDALTLGVGMFLNLLKERLGG
ncbi:amidohydrolase [candidate division WOR-3 bacterium]|nr:amidohydrolase [candidate division WOR-3 bacterium]